MRIPLIPLTNALRESIAETTLVTATARQAQELRYSWAFESFQSGQTAWKTPSIKNFDALVIGYYFDLARSGHPNASNGLLQRSALELAFRLCAPQAEYHKHTNAAVDAWRLYCEWHLRRVAPDLRVTENGRLFLEWVAAFANFRNEQEVVTVPELPSLIAEAVRSGSFVPQELTLFGCDDLSPARRELIDELDRKQLIHQSIQSQTVASQSIKAIRFESTAREKSGFSHWAREQLSSLGTDSRIGIVVPDLTNDYLTLRRSFEASFFDCDGIDQLVNIGEGVPLRDTRLVQDILKFLSWTIGELGYTEVLQLGRSPYLSGLEIPFEFSQHYPDRMRFAGFASRSQSETSKLITQLTTGRPKLLSEWMEIVSRILHLAGWTSEDDSVEERKIQASFVEVLNDVANLSSFVGRTYWSQAIQLVRDGARSHNLTYESRHAPVQVISRTDSIGMQFDALWVCGLAEDTWPVDANPNPMIPIKVQRKAVMPRVTHQQMLRWAQELTSMWEQSADNVVFSCAPRDEQTEVQPSRLIAKHGVTEVNEVLEKPELARHDHPWGEAIQFDVLREFIADTGTAPSEAELAEIRTSFLRDQSNCPFRAWAIHRTKLRDSQEPHRFPDPIDRGTMVHQTLQLLVENARDQEAIAKISEDQIDDAIDASTKRLKSLQLPDRFVQLERDRIRKIVDEWMQFELAREPFEVVEVESEHSVKVDGIRINLRVDRIDKTANFGALVIDYKTGAASVSNWRPPRPLDPQMPLYALAIHECDGLAYQQISGNQIRMFGVAELGDRKSGIVPASRRLGRKFGRLKNDWKSSLDGIAAEFKAGRASVLPTNPNYICRNCHLMSFCRQFAGVDFVLEELEEDSP
ncbi:MAG: PD-(D/E)XK nuclease family protein [Gammaproteobacteria bacterium]|nr:PD-(D/E)XK nuclease family protein [Gammaproteobacteria bacterium]